MKLNNIAISHQDQVVRNQNEFARSLGILGASFGMPQTHTNGNEYPGHRGQSRLTASAAKTASPIGETIRAFLANLVADQKRKQEIRQYLKLSDHYLLDIGFERGELERALIDGTKIESIRKKSAIFDSVRNLKVKQSGFAETLVDQEPCSNETWYRAA